MVQVQAEQSGELARQVPETTAVRHEDLVGVREVVDVVAVAQLGERTAREELRVSPGRSVLCGCDRRRGGEPVEIVDGVEPTRDERVCDLARKVSAA
jgi:hypothetical protein